MITQSKQALSMLAKQIADSHRDELEQLKREHEQLRRTDFVWHYLLQSFSTMGRAAGWHGLIGNHENYAKVTYEALANLSPEARDRQVRETCRAAKIRMPGKKADFILGCFFLIKALGGPAEAKARQVRETGRDNKIRFLRQFPGIGPKYARNMMMDVYHEDFRESIAIDVRIRAISVALGLSFSSYEEHERFYLDAAAMVGLNGWEMDRLLFNYRDDFERAIASTRASAES
ncbi:hypothetical protein [Rhodocyclus tenuis]|uniref:hypothetical protein n=1 Tax=Rhodocyclus tenuis TaxID=1066 RepID=UPI0019067A06|nr:hypothetical protein [Rhodocyclus tenuis]